MANNPWITASLILNLVVLVPVCTGLLLDARWIPRGFGTKTPARGILLSIYLTLAAASVLLLRFPAPLLVTGLLGLQVIYKAMTPWTVGQWNNPVVLSNLGIAAFHGVTLFQSLSSLSSGDFSQRP